MPDPDSPTEIKALVRRYFDAVNDGRWEDVADCFHDDATLHIPSQPVKVGREAILRFYSSHGRRFPAHFDDVPHVLVDGTVAAALIDFTGVDSSGTPIKFWTGDWWRVEGGRFREMVVIFDTAELGRSYTDSEKEEALRHSEFRPHRPLPA